MSRMNVVFIFTDQQNRDALGCMGNPNLETPNLDRLAEKGVLFRRCYSNHPVCGPYRGALMTGQYTSRCGVTRNQSALPAGTTTFADAFNAAGYQTSWVGKWHLGGNGNGPIPEELRGGFQRFKGYQCYNGFYKDVCFYDEQNREHRYDYHRTEVTTDLALSELDTLTADSAGRPFMLMVSYQAPHYPVQPAPEYEAMYKDRKIVRRPNGQEVDPFTPTVNPRSPSPHELDPDFQRYGNDLDAYIRLYNAMCTQMDANVGRLLRRLESLGVADDTMIVFTSDHGDMQGSHGLKNKHVPYEESVGIPLIIHVPKLPGCRVSDCLVSGIDMMPTCLELAGIEPVDTVDGQSIAPILRGQTDTTRNTVFSECGWRMIITEEWKLAARHKDGVWTPFLMTHIAEDPYEQNNRVDNPSDAAIQESLLARLQKWHQDVCGGAKNDSGVSSHDNHKEERYE